MLKRPKIKILILLISIIIIGCYFFISSLIGKQKFSILKSLLNTEQKELIKKYIFPYKVISKQQQIISQQQQQISRQEQQISRQEQGLKFVDFLVVELEKKRSGSDITTEENIEKLSINKTLKKYKLNSGFYYGIHEEFPGSGYIDFHKGNIIVLSSRGVLAFKKNIVGDSNTTRI